jgi:hypothetical protein
VKRNDAEHLVHMLQQVGYKLSQEWDGKCYCGLTLEWVYDKRTWCVCFDARLRQASTTALPASISALTRTFSLSLESTQIWCKGTICRCHWRDASA